MFRYAKHENFSCLFEPPMAAWEIKMKYVNNVTDKGIVLSPSEKGEKYYDWDGGGIREAVVKRVGDTYYLSYDGAIPGAAPTSYWNACEAVSKDLIHWEKRGVTLLSSALTHPESDNLHYKDFCSASSPWDFFDGKKWYRYYVGADHCSPEGIPAFIYSTMLAVADSADGPWRKLCDEPGKGNFVCIRPGGEGSWDEVTASPGQVIENPRYKDDPENERRYLMFYSGSCAGETKRSIGIARTDDLCAADDFSCLTGNFWIKDENPIIPPQDDIENTSIFYEEETGLYWLFTNHIYNNEYTNSVWVYWSYDPEKWNPENKAVVIDKTVSTFAKGAIGMPTVVRISKDKLGLLYDGALGDSTSHLDRHIGYAEISLPISVK